MGFIISGIFGAYALGANNVANVTGIFAGELKILTTNQAVIIGGLSIALGAITYSKPVMSTIGERIVPMSSVAGFIVVISASITVYIYAKIGIPVSTSQAVVGAILGIGLNVGVNTINFRVLRNIMLGWFGTPTIAGIISYAFSVMRS
jgi:PiT family inorganic phosphate transporter